MDTFYFWMFGAQGLGAFDIAIVIWALVRLTTSKGVSFKAIAASLVFTSIVLGWVWQERQQFHTQHLWVSLAPLVMLVIALCVKDKLQVSKFERTFLIPVLLSATLVGVLIEVMAFSPEFKTIEAAKKRESNPAIGGDAGFQGMTFGQDTK
ncbi:hypothetical protein KF707_04885 [Candidatus Obscuribacterales bacterium]|nr:hypothetical protein [Candidatus Obscuribacterales bacterium]